MLDCFFTRWILQQECFEGVQKQKEPPRRKSKPGQGKVVHGSERKRSDSLRNSQPLIR